MADNETRIRLTAVDETTKVLNSISGAVKGLTGDWGKLGAAAGALGLTGAIAGIGAMVKSAIDAAAAMGDLSQKTGIAVGDLTALDYAMRREGASTEAFAKGIKELSKNLVEAGDATSKAGKLFSVLGVEASAGPREALLKIADAFQALPDGATKATLAAQLFGKAGIELIPALNNGAKGIREIEAEARRLGITFGGETARSAKEFQDNMFALGASAKSLGVALAEKTLPGLTRISAAMKEAVQDAGLFKAAFVGLGGLLSEALGLNDSEGQKLEKHLASLREKLESVGKSIPTDRREALLKNLVEPATIAEGEFRRLNLQMQATKGFLDKLRAAAKQGEFVGPPAPSQSELERRLREQLRGPTTAAVDPARNLLISLQLEYTKLNSLTKENETLERTLAELKKESYAKASQGLKDQAVAQAKLIDDLKKRIAAEQFLASLNQKEIDAAAERGRALEELSNQWAEGTEQLEQELKLLGLTNLGREKAILLERARLDIVAAGDNASAVRDIEASLARQLSLVDQIHLKNLDIVNAQREQANAISAWDELSDRVIQGISDWRGALNNFWRDAVALFSKKLILQIGASVTGSAGLAAQAAGVGEGTLASSVGSLVSSGIAGATGLAFTGPGLSQGFGLAASNIGVAGYFGGFGANAALAGSSLSAGSIGTAVGVMMPYLLPIIAVAALAYSFRDKGENWKGRIGFGSGANAYTTDGVFGREGFQYLAGNDAVNSQLQAFMASTRPLDEQINRGLTDAQRAAISGSLAAYNASGARRADGQPAEFAFGKGDDTAAQQLTLEYLQQKYGAVFDTIDTTFATFIRDYTGKSEDLLKEIGSFAAVLESLRVMDINGLDVEGLRGFQRAGETLEQTFARVGGSWQQFEQLFTTDAERFAAAQASISDVFADLGVAVPASKDKFEALVRGLDLSTEAGRKMFESLMAIAPAFAAVADAANASWMELQGLIDEYKPGQTLAGAAGQFQGANPWAGGLSPAQLIEQLLTITEEDFGKYSAANQQLIKDILRLGRAASGAADSLEDVTFSGVYGLTPDQLARNRAIEAAQQLAEAFRDAKTALGEYIDGLFLSDKSPLSDAEKFDLAKADFIKTIAAALGGDLGAINSLPNIADLLLTLGQGMFASGTDYAELFQWVTDQLAGVADVPGYNERMMAAGEESAFYAKAGFEVQTDIHKVLMDIFLQAPVLADQITDTVRDANTERR
jgi:hypothetical protein